MLYPVFAFCAVAALVCAVPAAVGSMASDVHVPPPRWAVILGVAAVALVATAMGMLMAGYLLAEPWASLNL